MRFLRIFGFAFIMTSLLSCKKEKTNTPNQGIAGLVVFNLAPDQNKVLVTVDGNYFNGVPLGYATYSGKYNGVYAGTRELVSLDQASNLDLAKTNATFKDSSYYSMFFVGKSNTYRNILIEDKLSSIPRGTGNAFVRYFYAITDSLGAHVSVEKDGNKIFDQSSSFGNYTDFKPVTPGNVSFSIVNADSTINKQRTLDLKANTIYTVLFQGYTQTLDTTKQIKINYIQNGVVQ